MSIPAPAPGSGVMGLMGIAAPAQRSGATGIAAPAPKSGARRIPAPASGAVR
ncbi:hypothetical protein GCM10010345_56950 [Streptomyces canarius]|uniref:Uncharacterized protein n=1 Tax=Streptomyces canarius TaxID=285453 RepID=A0ABQ3CWU9_9ACTN|nr:hypothetical protein GCM10010345_56950 [Streptomyces canarius]